jgi:hypothetical protein
MSTSTDFHRTSVRRDDGGAGSTSPPTELRLREGRAHVGPKEAFGLGRKDGRSFSEACLWDREERSVRRGFATADGQHVWSHRVLWSR